MIAEKGLGDLTKRQFTKSYKEQGVVEGRDYQVSEGTWHV